MCQNFSEICFSAWKDSHKLKVLALYGINSKVEQPLNAQENNHHHRSLKMKIEIFYLKCCSPNFLLLAPKAVPYTISTNISRYKTAFSKIAKNIFVRISKLYCKQCSIDIKTSSWAKHNQYQYSSNATQCVVHTINTNIDPNHILIGLAGRLYWWGWEGW